MKIFKNRGDIYISKSRTGADREQHILLGVLAGILLLSAVVVLYAGAKSDFSAKKFFAPEQTVSVSAAKSDATAPAELPQVSGKTNYLLALTGKDNQNLYAAVLIQTDMDSVSYKVCNLLPVTTAESSTLMGVYTSGGINSLVQMTETVTGVKPDFYVVMTLTDFASFFDDLGQVNYPLAADIKYRNTQSADPFSVRYSAGEAELNGKRFVSLLRYFLEEKDLKSANDLGLTALNMLFQAENGAKKDQLFRDFIALARTNLTVRDFSRRSDNITVLTATHNGVNAYNVEPEYTGNALTARSKRTIQGYFSK